MILFRDTTVNEYIPEVRCKFKDCITKLNSMNAKRQSFCHVHQVKVQGIICCQPDHKDRKRYKRIMDGHNSYKRGD